MNILNLKEKIKDDNFNLTSEVFEYDIVTEITDNKIKEQKFIEEEAKKMPEADEDGIIEIFKEHFEKMKNDLPFAINFEYFELISKKTKNITEKFNKETLNYLKTNYLKYDKIKEYAIGKYKSLSAETTLYDQIIMDYFSKLLNINNIDKEKIKYEYIPVFRKIIKFEVVDYKTVEDLLYLTFKPVNVQIKIDLQIKAKYIENEEEKAKINFNINMFDNTSDNAFFIYDSEKLFGNVYNQKIFNDVNDYIRYLLREKYFITSTTEKSYSQDLLIFRSTEINVETDWKFTLVYKL